MTTPFVYAALGDLQACEPSPTLPEGDVWIYRSGTETPVSLTSGGIVRRNCEKEDDMTSDQCRGLASSLGCL